MGLRLQVSGFTFQKVSAIAFACADPQISGSVLRAERLTRLLAWEVSKYCRSFSNQSKVSGEVNIHIRGLGGDTVDTINLA